MDPGVSASENGLSSLTAAAVNGMRRGIEKESLRARADVSLATTPHPAALGSPLTHAHITTDFSESQLELITGALTSVDSMLEELTFIHQVVYRALAQHGTNEPFRNHMLDFDGINRLIGTADMLALGKRYETETPPATKTSGSR